MGLYNSLKYFFQGNWWYLSIIVLLILSFSYFTYYQSIPTFPDPDSFYHTKISLLISEQGVFKTFPWLQATILKDSYIDQHFLYHVFLIPFVRLFDPIMGVKLANIILSVLLILLFYWFLRKYKIKFAFLFTLILMVSTPFIFRINLIKAPVFSIILLIIGLHLLFQYRYLGVFLLSFLFVWSYGGFILIVVFAGIYMVVGLLKDLWQSIKNNSKNFMIGHNKEIKLFLATIGGVSAGLVINPFFPQNINFYWNQLIKIGIINYQNVISVGAEWYPYKFMDLAAGAAITSILVIIALIFFVLNFKKLTKKTLSLFVIFIFFLIFTLKSKRYVEYYIPFALIFSAFSLNEILKLLKWTELWQKVVRLFDKQKFLVMLLVIYLLIAFPTVIIKNIKQTYGDFENGISIHRFEKSATWLKNNSAQGDVVFHSSWDEFPILFYYNSHNYYIAGLDPTFTYEYDKDLYQKMVDITIGNQKDNLYQDISEGFGASYIFVEIKHTAMDKNIRQVEKFELVYQDDEAKIYKIL